MIPAEPIPILSNENVTLVAALALGVLMAYGVQLIVLSTMSNGAWGEVSPRRRLALARMGGVSAIITGLSVLTTDPSPDLFQKILHLWLAQTIAGAAGARAVQVVTARAYPLEPLKKDGEKP